MLYFINGGIAFDVCIHSNTSPWLCYKYNNLCGTVVITKMLLFPCPKQTRLNVTVSCVAKIVYKVINDLFMYDDK